MSASPECGHVEVWLGIEDINLGEDDGGGEEDKSYHADRQRNVVLNSQTVTRNYSCCQTRSKALGYIMTILGQQICRILLRNGKGKH